MISLRDIKNPEDIKSLSYNELKHLANEIRNFLIDNISQTGGHIGANLGTIELTIALHYVFDSPRDKIIWDIGHQGYTHKILTGRAHLFTTLNKYGGMNRFITWTESKHDVIEASHAGTSVSVALGIALAKKLNGLNDYTIAVVGDGTLAEGMIWEALNHAAVTKTRLIIILNDNGYAISAGFGALHNYLSKMQLGDKSPETFFTSLGFHYIGPIDGHDIQKLSEALQFAKSIDKVSILHAKTIKGCGLPLAEHHPFKMHFSFPFDKKTGKIQKELLSTGYQDIAASIIEKEMENEDKIIAITPSTLYATGLQKVFDRFPNRCYDPGMEEQHAMTMAVGLALEGYKPIVFYQSTFLQRAYDQLFHDVCFMNKPILLLTVRTGFAGYDNSTHHGIYDFAYLRGLPNIRLMYPKDRFELERMIRDNLRNLTGPVLISMPYGPVDIIDESVLDEPPQVFRRAQVIEKSREILIITVGNKFLAARDTVEELKNQGINAGLVNLRYLKPLPEEQLVNLMRDTLRVVTLEEGVLDGGVGSSIAALAIDNNVRCEMLRIGIPCKFVEPGSNSELCKVYGLEKTGILAKINKRWPELFFTK